LPSPPKKITEQNLILGEGDGDEAFFRYLCGIRAIGGFGFDSVGGNTDFERYLKALASQSSLKSLLIVADNDEHPDDNFRNVQGQIGRAKLPQPNNPLHRASRPGSPHIVVLMLPYPRVGNSSHGALETMLLPSAEQQLAAQAVCVGQYSDCILRVGQPWARTERDKMRLRCLLSGSSNTDPNISLRHALNPVKNLIPLTHATFDPMVRLLTHFVEWMDSAHVNWEDWTAANP
jgi:hypothetical protein